jgi:hypothetical protein
MVAMLACLATSLMIGLVRLGGRLGELMLGRDLMASCGLPAAVPGRWLDGCPSGIDFLNSPWVSSAAMLGTAGSFTLYIRGVQEVAVGEAVHVNTSIVMAKVMIVFQAFHFSGRVCS